MLLSRAALSRAARPLLLRASAPRALRVAWVAAERSVSTASPSIGVAVAELERLETQLPWWQSAMLRLGGTFSDEQWQAAAGGDED